MAPQTIHSPARLQDIDPATGYSFLACPKGDEIAVEKYKRLAALPINAAAVAAKPEPLEEKPAPRAAAADLDAMNKTQLLVTAKQLGLEFATKDRIDEIREAVREAQIAESAEPVEDLGEGR